MTFPIPLDPHLSLSAALEALREAFATRPWTAAAPCLAYDNDRNFGLTRNGQRLLLQKDDHLHTDLEAQKLKAWFDNDPTIITLRSDTATHQALSPLLNAIATYCENDADYVHLQTTVAEDERKEATSKEETVVPQPKPTLSAGWVVDIHTPKDP